MAGFLEQGVLTLESLGLTDVLLPFVLIFTVVFAVLQKTHILGQDKKNLNVVLALVMALGVIIPHITGSYPAGADVVNIINQSLPNVSLVLIAILMVLLLIGMFGWSIGGEGTTVSGIIAMLCFAAVVYIFGAAADLWRLPSWLSVLESPDTQALIVVILIFGIIVWFITKEEPKEKQASFMEEFGKQLFKKGGGGKDHHN